MPGTLTGVVRSTAGTPDPGATVRLRLGDLDGNLVAGWDAAGLLAVEETVEADDLGAFAFAGLVPTADLALSGLYYWVVAAGRAYGPLVIVEGDQTVSEARDAAPDPEALGAPALERAKGVAGGVAELGLDGKVPTAQLPDEVVLADTLEADLVVFGAQLEEALVPRAGNVTLTGPLDGFPEPPTPTAPLRPADLDVLAEPAAQGRQHRPYARAWLDGLSAAELGTRAARVVGVWDSIGELTGGMATVWRTIDETVGGTGGFWRTPYFSNLVNMEGLVATPSALGLDRRGAIVAAGAAPFGRMTAVPGLVELDSIPSTLDVFYTAHPDGADVTIEVDGEVVDTFDSSLDEDGNPVVEDVPSQRWRSPVLALEGVPWSLEVTGTGTLKLEAVGAPGSAIERNGSGLSGTPTGAAAPGLLVHVEAMVARGEPPDLVVLHADTAEAGTTAAAAVAQVVEDLRAVVPGVSIAHVIPHGHANWGHTPPGAEDLEALEAAQAVHARAHRLNDAALGLIVVDLWEAMGPATSQSGQPPTAGQDPHGWTSDGVHFTSKGGRAAASVYLDVLAGARQGPDRRVAAIAEAARTVEGGTITGTDRYSIGEAGWVEVGPTQNPTLGFLHSSTTPGTSLRIGIEGEDYARLELAGARLMVGDGSDHPAMTLNQHNRGNPTWHAVAGTSTLDLTPHSPSSHIGGTVIGPKGSGGGTLTVPVSPVAGLFKPIVEVDIVNRMTVPWAIAPASGVAIGAPAGSTLAIKPLGRARLINPSSSNEWQLSGDLVPA